MKHLWIIVLIGILFLYYHRGKLLASNPASKEKVIYTPSSDTMYSYSYSIWFVLDNWSNTPKVLFQQYRGNSDEIELLVYFDNYINNLNIFLPELSNTYQKSNNCKITEPPVKEVKASEQECMNMCSKTMCNSYSYETDKQKKDQGNIEFYFDDSFKGNNAYINFMKKVKEDTIGKCSLFSISPIMPNNCFLEQDKNETEPYSVYDWNSITYNMDVTSYRLNKYSFPIPIQEWTNLIITIDEFIVEVYVNGKIVKSIMLDNKKHNIPSKIVITPDGYGFNGKTRDFKYWNKCLSAKEINNLSKKVSN